MNLINLKGIKKIYKNYEKRKGDLFTKGVQKSFEKKQKPHVIDIKEKKEKEEIKQEFNEDETLTAEEKEHVEISDILNIPVDKTEIYKTRKLHEDLPPEIRSYSKGGGFFTCVYCYKKNRGWYYHRNECPQYLENGKCEYCQLPLETIRDAKEHSKKCKVKNASASLSK